MCSFFIVEKQTVRKWYIVREAVKKRNSHVWVFWVMWKTTTTHKWSVSWGSQATCGEEGTLAEGVPEVMQPCLPQLNGLFPRHCSLLTPCAAASTRAENMGAGRLPLTLSPTLSLTGAMNLSLRVLLGSKLKKRSQFSAPLSFCNWAGWSEKETEGKSRKEELANVQRKKTSS